MSLLKTIAKEGLKVLSSIAVRKLFDGISNYISDSSDNSNIVNKKNKKNR